MPLKKCNTLLASGGCSTKDTNDAYILTIVRVAQNLADDSKGLLKKFNWESTKVEPAYIRDLPPQML